MSTKEEEENALKEEKTKTPTTTPKTLTWRTGSFVGEFGDAFIQDTDLEGGQVAPSIDQLVEIIRNVNFLTSFIHPNIIIIIIIIEIIIIITTSYHRNPFKMISQNPA